MNKQFSEQEILVMQLEAYIRRGIKNEFYTIKERDKKSQARQGLLSELDEMS